jgi:hypothetical protein
LHSLELHSLLLLLELHASMLLLLLELHSLPLLLELHLSVVASAGAAFPAGDGAAHNAAPDAGAAHSAAPADDTVIHHPWHPKDHLLDLYHEAAVR